MYIRNPDKIDLDKVISVNKEVGEYLVRNGFPLMSKDIDGNFLFVKKCEIEEAIEKLNKRREG